MILLGSNGVISAQTRCSLSIRCDDQNAIPLATKKAVHGKFQFLLREALTVSRSCIRGNDSGTGVKGGGSPGGGRRAIDGCELVPSKFRDWRVAPVAV